MLKKILNKIKRQKSDFVSKVIAPLFSKTEFLSGLYYLFFSSQFRREKHAVLNGKVKNIKESKKDKSNLYTLIRNIHRIEKGLLMRPRRDVFAVDFITETVDNFEFLDEKLKNENATQFKWAHDVLDEYFRVTSSHPIIDRERKRYLKIKINNTNPTALAIPYRRMEENKPKISYDDFYSLTKYRRSVRWFRNEKVPHELVDKAILAANQSPSACNRQPFEYRIIDDKELLEKVVNIPMGIKGYQHNVPMIVVVIGNLDAYFDERDRHVMYIDASLANMTFMLALETLGLSSCSINWPDIEALEKKMETVLKLKKFQRPIMCMAIGYPDPEGMVAFSEKRDIELLRKYN